MNTKSLLKSSALAAMAVSGMTAIAPEVYAGGKITIDDTKWISVGAGLRTSFTSVEDGADTGTDRSFDLSMDSVRMYIGGQLHEKIGFTFNTAKSGGSVNIMDAVAQITVSDSTNVWVGRHLPATGRINMDGPYYLGDWSFPVVAMGYGNYYPGGTGYGRDDGITYWGMSGDDRLKYKIGLYEGLDGSAGASGGATAKKDDPLIAARLQYNFWDTEPGYYNASTYYGSKDILSLGVTVMSQTDAATATTNAGDFSHIGIDGLFEKKLGDGNVATVEFGWYDYDRDDKGTTTNEGDGYFLLGAYQIGSWKPNVRIQSFSPAPAGSKDMERMDAGVDYIIDGHNARISINYTDNFTNTNVSANEKSALTVGLQVQI